MIQRLSHACIYVLDQDEARDFYVNKFGFEVRMDHKMDGGFRWLTVGAKGQPDLELVLMGTQPTRMMDEATSESLRALVKAGKMPGGVMKTADCQKTYAELVEKGVEFIAPPTERFYGIEALVKDNSGNWFSLTQPKPNFS